MKKNIIIILISIIVITGCANKKESTIVSVDKKIIENENLIVEEKIEQTEFDTYIEEINVEVENLTNKEELSIKEKNVLKNTFITLTDFIFYQGEINGITFEQLTDDVKAKIISIYEEIDASIEEKYPGYKDEIEKNAIRTYNDIKDKVQQVKESLLNQYKKEVGEEKYNEQVAEYENTKEEIIDALEPVAEESVEAVGKLYEITKNNLDKWYHEWKEE